MIWLILIIEFLFVFTLVVFYFSKFVYHVESFHLKIPTIKTKKEDLLQLLESIKITENDVVYDLGSGTGTTLHIIETKTKAKTVGFEANIVPFFYSILKNHLYKYKTVFHLADLRRVDVSQATVIYMYLSADLMSLLENKIHEQTNPNVQIVSCDFPFPNVKPEKILKYSKNTFYIYKKSSLTNE